MKSNGKMINYEIDSGALQKSMLDRKVKSGQLADEIGISRNTMSRTLMGHTIPSLEVVDLICRCLKLTDFEILNIFHHKNKE